MGYLLIFEAIDHNFYEFTAVITHLGCWENTKKAWKSRAEASDLQVFRSSVLPTSEVGYHVGKPIEIVVYCFYKKTLSKLTNQNARTIFS